MVARGACCISTAKLAFTFSTVRKATVLRRVKDPMTNCFPGSSADSATLSQTVRLLLCSEGISLVAQRPGHQPQRASGLTRHLADDDPTLTHPSSNTARLQALA